MTNQQDNAHKNALETMRSHINVRDADEDMDGYVYIMNETSNYLFRVLVGSHFVVSHHHLGNECEDSLSQNFPWKISGIWSPFIL